MMIIWRFCECLGIRPPGVRKNWGDNDVQTQALILAYYQRRTENESN